MPYLSLVPLLLGLAAPVDPATVLRPGLATDPAPAAPAPSGRPVAVPRLARLTPPATPPLATPAPASDEATRSATARTHYSERRYLEAARMYEQLWRDTQAAKYRFNAGMARSAAEHDGAAIVHWQAYLDTAPSVTARERSMLTAEIAAAKQRTRPLKLKIQGPLAPASLTLTAPADAPQGPRDPIDLIPATAIDLSLEPGRWTATLARPGRPLASVTFTAEAGAVITLGGDPPPTLEPPPAAQPADPTPPATPIPATLTLTLGPRRALASGVEVRLRGPAPIPASELRGPEQTWQLPPGAWTVRAEARDHEPRSADLQLGPGELRRLDLQLQLDRAARTRRGLGLGLGVTGFGLFTAGVIVAASNAGTLDCATRLACQDAANTVLDRSIGLALLGTGLGAAGVAVTAGLTRKDRALLVETGLGGALLTGGLAWYLTEVTQTTALDHRGREHGAATLLGLGGGMFGAAIISLVTRRLTRDRRPPIALAPSFRGLSLAARF